MAQTHTSGFKWRSIVGLIIVYIAVWFDLQWVWGILFLIWVVPDLMTGVTYFMEPIFKEENPWLYWLIVISWILMSAYSIAFLFFPEWKYYM